MLVRTALASLLLLVGPVAAQQRPAPPPAVSPPVMDRDARMTAQINVRRELRTALRAIQDRGRDGQCSIEVADRAADLYSNAVLRSMAVLGDDVSAGVKEIAASGMASVVTLHALSVSGRGCSVEARTLLREAILSHPLSGEQAARDIILNGIADLRHAEMIEALGRSGR